MKRTIFWSISLSIAFMLVTTTDAAYSVLAFMLVGAIPGTSLSVPSPFMLSGIVIIASYLVIRIANLLRIFSRQSDMIYRHSNNLPKRRYQY